MIVNMFNSTKASDGDFEFCCSDLAYHWQTKCWNPCIVMEISEEGTMKMQDRKMQELIHKL